MHVFVFWNRLLEANEKLQKLNQTLEDKLLKLAEKHHAETSGLSEQIQDLTQRLVDARLYIHQLADENVITQKSFYFTYILHM